MGLRHQSDEIPNVSVQKTPDETGTDELFTRLFRADVAQQM